MYFLDCFLISKALQEFEPLSTSFLILMCINLNAILLNTVCLASVNKILEKKVIIEAIVKRADFGVTLI